MRRLLLAVVVLVLLLVAAVAGAWLFVPDAWIRGQLEAAVRDATGREFAIRGAFRLTRWPLRLEAEDIRLANAPWARTPEMVAIRRLELALDPWALWQRTLRVERLTLEGARIALERAADGRTNWTFGQGEAGAAAGGGGGEAGGWRLRLEQLRLMDAALLFDDATRNRVTRLEDLALTLEREDATDRLRLAGQAQLDGQPVRLSGRMADPASLTGGGEGPVELALELPQGGIRLAGRVRGPAPRIDARLEVALEDLRGLLEPWGLLAPDMAPGALRTLALGADLGITPRGLTLADLRFALDELQGQGELDLALDEARPRLRGSLALATLDLTPYLPPPAKEGGESAETAAAGWSEEPLNLPLPAALDADLTVTWEGLRARALELGPAKLALKLAGPQAEIRLEELALYEGRARGRLAATAAEEARFALFGRIEGVQVRPLLRALAGLDRLEGRGFAEFDLTTRGGSVKALIQGLAGRGQVEFRDGAILGFNLAAMVRQVTSLGLTQEAAPRRTDFARLGASFVVAAGILRTDDIALEAPLLRVRGGGTVDLPARRLELRLEPALAATLEGQGGGEPRFALAVPVVIAGPWESPEWRFDFGEGVTAVLDDPAALDTLVQRLRADPTAVARLGERFGEAQQLLGVTPERLRQLLPPGVLPDAARILPGAGPDDATPPVPDLQQLAPLLRGEAPPAAGAGQPDAGAKDRSPQAPAGPQDLLRQLLPR